MAFRGRAKLHDDHLTQDNKDQKIETENTKT